LKSFGEHVHDIDVFDLILLPKTLGPKNSNNHGDIIYKGLAVLIGIYVFFVIETFIKMIKSTAKKEVII
jgi:hypothetical protein